MTEKYFSKSIIAASFYLLLTGCVQSPPSPTVSPKQLKTALEQTELNLQKEIQKQAKKTTEVVQQQANLLTTLQNNQQQLLTQLNEIEEKWSKQQASLNKPKAKPQPATTETTIGNKMLVGSVEALWIEAANQVFDARVDTGATTSSISARNVVILEKDGKPWVKFELLPAEDSAQSYEVEAPLVRYVKIRQSSADGLDRRPVVRLKVRLGKMTEDAQFTLADRTEMNYPILLGRQFLKDIAVVDVAKKYVQPKPTVIKNPVPTQTSVPAETPAANEAPAK